MRNCSLIFILKGKVLEKNFLKIFLLFRRNGRPYVFCEKAVLKNFEKIAGYHSRWIFFSDFHLLQQGFHRHYFPVNFGNFSEQPLYRASVNSCFYASRKKLFRLNIQDPRTICKVLRKFTTKSSKWRHPFVTLSLILNKVRHPWGYTKSAHTWNVYLSPRPSNECRT